MSKKSPDFYLGEIHGLVKGLDKKFDGHVITCDKKLEKLDGKIDSLNVWRGWTKGLFAGISFIFGLIGAKIFGIFK